MNRIQKKLLISFTVFVALILAAATGVLAYAVRETKREYRGDIFDSIVAKDTAAWLQPTLICLGGALLVGITVFAGLLKLYSSETPSKKN